MWPLAAHQLPLRTVLASQPMLPEDMVVAAGQKLAVIRTTTSGVLHVTEVSG